MLTLALLIFERLFLIDIIFHVILLGCNLNYNYSCYSFKSNSNTVIILVMKVGVNGMVLPRIIINLVMNAIK